MTPRQGEVAIHQWTDDDLAAVRHITWTTWQDAYGAFIPPADLLSYYDEHYSTEALRALLASDDFRGYLATVDGVPAGYCKAQYNPEEKKLYLASLYVLPGYQGFGLGTRLMEMAEERARFYGLDCIWLGVMTQNARTLAWYERIGFTFVETKPFQMGSTAVEHRIGWRKC